MATKSTTEQTIPKENTVHSETSHKDNTCLRHPNCQIQKVLLEDGLTAKLMCHDCLDSPLADAKVPADIFSSSRINNLWSEYCVFGNTINQKFHEVIEKDIERAIDRTIQKLLIAKSNIKKNLINLTDQQPILDFDLDESFRIFRETMKIYASQQEITEDLDLTNYQAHFYKVEKVLSMQDKFTEAVDNFLKDLIENSKWQFILHFWIV